MIDSCKRGLRKIQQMARARINAGGISEADRAELAEAIDYIEVEIKVHAARQRPIHDEGFLDRLRCTECKQLLDEVQQKRAVLARDRDKEVVGRICKPCFDGMSEERKDELHIPAFLRTGATPTEKS